MTTKATKQPPPLRWVGTFVDERVREIQDGYFQDHSGAVATLAKLRRGAGKVIADVPELWGLTLDDRFYKRVSYAADPEWEEDPAEEAAHIALTLYAVHQQSLRDDRMHQRGPDLGAAVRRLMPRGEIDEPLRRRFVQVGTAHDLPTLAHRLRAVVVLLRRGAVPLDYGLLADRIHRFSQPGGRKYVRAAWGRSFHASSAALPTEAPTSSTDTPTETDEDTA